VHFAHYARTVTLLVRGPALRATMSQYLEFEPPGPPVESGGSMMGRTFCGAR
jgi:hypothetical protein